MFWPKLDELEIASVQWGLCQLGLLVEGDVIVLIYQFGLLEYGDCSYSFWLVPKEERILPPPVSPNTGVRLPVILVEGQTGIVVALRNLVLPPVFARALFAAIRAQAHAAFFDPHAYDDQLALLNARFPTSEALFQRAQVRCCIV